MKKLIALLAVATMLFGLVGTASAYDVAMEVFVNDTLIQTGPGPNYLPGDDYDLSYSFTPSNNWQFSNNITINISGKYEDAKKWYNYGNSNEQAAWIRIPIIFDSVDANDFPNINSKSTQWNTSGKLIQSGSYVTINGVMYPVGVIKGHTENTAYPYASGNIVNYKYKPFWTDNAGTTNLNQSATAAGDKFIVADTTNGQAGLTNVQGAGYTTINDAIGIYYSAKLQSGGMSETLNISYSPNGVEVYKATINIIYMDTATANNATMARETGANAPYFNSKFSGGDTMAFDTVLKSGSMISSMEKYRYRDADGKTYYDDSDKSAHTTVYADMYSFGTGSAQSYANKAYVEFPTIVMEAKIKLMDKSGNVLPQRTQIKGSVAGKTYNDGTNGNGLVYGHYSDVTGAIVTATTGADLTVSTKAADSYLFRSADVYASSFSAATETDDGVYHELDSSGEYTVTVRVLDNTSSLYKALLDAFVTEAIGSGSNSAYTIKPYFVPLNNVEINSGTSSAITIEGVKNRVNYTYLEDVKQDVYTYNMYDRQYLKYDINLNSLDRIEASSFAITGNSSEMLAVGSTRQLQATTGHASAIITDRQVNWKSSNPAVATVNATTGLVTAVADGTTYITAQYAVGTGYDTVAVTVGTAPVATPEITAPTTTQYFVAVGSSSSLNVRSGANTKSARVGRLKRGDTVNVYEIVDGWAKIDYNGSIAYVSSRYISQ